MSIGGPHPAPEPAEGLAANGLQRESVWDYPRPPAIRPEPREVTVSLGGTEIAHSRRAVKICETAGPPVIYLPPSEVDRDAVRPVAGGSHCEWKGNASYFDATAGGRVAARAAWTYANPQRGYEAIRDWIAFYPGRVECKLGNELVTPQPGEFYGGWITAEITGPFKGIPGSSGW